MTAVVLAGDALAPITSSIGFLGAPLGEAAAALAGWRRRLHGDADTEPLPGGLLDHVSRLEPLTGGARPRELLVATAAQEWTAVLDCGVAGGDPSSTVGYLAEQMGVHGVVVVSVPDGPDRMGARQLEIFGPVDTDWLNQVRAISVIRDDDRWRFDATGTVQDFEDESAYTRRRVADRFTDEMLVAYAAALGLRPFDVDFYPGPCVLVTNPAEVPSNGLELSLADARRRLGLA